MLHVSPAETDTANRTLYYEKWRAVFSGILETGGSTFLLLVALQHFNANETAKGLIASGGSIGLLLSPVVLHVVSLAGWRVSAVGAVISVIGATGFLLAALIPDVYIFVGGSILGLLCITSYIPLLTQMYQDNYPAAQRGRLFSRTVVIRIAASALFAQAAGSLLTGNLQRYPLLLLQYCLCMLFSAYCLWRCPSSATTAPTGGPFRALRWVREDITFRRTLIAWMLMGFANLLMVPLRVEYMGNRKYGLCLTAAPIALLNVVIPNLARLAISPLWGRIFDKMNFFALRIALNIGFAAAILAFFTGDSSAGLGTGAVIFGIANAGGEVAWSLWGTKIAPPERVAEYMSVHTFCTGIRGVCAPLLAFQLLKTLDINTLSLICAAFIAAASLVLIPEYLAVRASQRLKDDDLDPGKGAKALRTDFLG